MFSEFKHNTYSILLLINLSWTFLILFSICHCFAGLFLALSEMTALSKYSLSIIGAFAAVIDVGTSWMSDLKEGICLEQFWFNREQCCWAVNDTVFDQNVCSQVNH